MANVARMMRSELTPMSVEVAGSCATARMPRPVFDFAMKRSTAIIMTTAAMMIVSCWLSMMVPPRSKTGFGVNIVTAGSAFLLWKAKIAYWMTKLTPIAVMRKTRRGALRLRSGLYARRSTATAVVHDAIMPTIMASNRLRMIGPMPRFGGEPLKPSADSVKITPYAPTMNTSEWAKLMRLSTP